MIRNIEPSFVSTNPFEPHYSNAYASFVRYCDSSIKSFKGAKIMPFSDSSLKEKLMTYIVNYSSHSVASQKIRQIARTWLFAELIELQNSKDADELKFECADVLCLLILCWKTGITIDPETSHFTGFYLMQDDLRSLAIHAISQKAMSYPLRIGYRIALDTLNNLATQSSSDRRMVEAILFLKQSTTEFFL